MNASASFFETDPKSKFRPDPARGLYPILRHAPFTLSLSVRQNKLLPVFERAAKLEDSADFSLGAVCERRP